MDGKPSLKEAWLGHVNVNRLDFGERLIVSGLST